MKNMKKSVPNPRANQNIMFVIYIVTALFLGMIVYFGYFLQVKSGNVINNSYNARLDSFSERVVRGKIEGLDGSVLAETLLDESGNETRSYPYGPVFSHIVGFSAKGKTGLEALGNFYMLTSHMNPGVKISNELSGTKNTGDNIITTLNPVLQQAAYHALGDRRGAVVVMEPDTGKILAMVSKPDFDPNTIAEDWSSIVSEDNTTGQLLNRATQGLYPPGSTFKIVTALEYMREHPLDYHNDTFNCSGVYQTGEYQIKCYHGNAHGEQNLTTAFANSCNGAFAALGQELNLNNMYQLSSQLLFNSEQPLSLPYSKSVYNMKSDADVWEILQTSIGQGTTQITPMHNAMLVSAIANGGILMKPYLIDHVESPDGETVKSFMPSAYGNLMTAKEASNLTELMKAVVMSGTGSAVRTDSYTAAGKTGSAEFDSKKETHAWFVGFAPAEDPQLAVSVIVEEGGSGGQTAAPIARSIFDTWFIR